MYCPADQLWIMTDSSVRQHSIHALMNTDRGGRQLLCVHFSTKLHGHQPTWLPCEVEVLAIATAIKHFDPYLIQSRHHLAVLTNSKPCVQTYENLCQGQFSTSPRLILFLSIVCHFQASVQHLAGRANLLAILLAIMLLGAGNQHVRSAPSYRYRRRFLCLGHPLWR